MLCVENKPIMLNVVMLNVVSPLCALMLGVVGLRVVLVYSLSKLGSWIQIKILNEYS